MLHRRILLTFIFLLILAAGLRFYKLGEWSFDTDEPYTILETKCLMENPNIADDLPISSEYRSQIYRLPRLLCAAHFVHWLNYKLIGEDDFSSRVFPAVIGTFTVGIVFLLAKPLFGFSMAFILALLICLNPEHIYHSQNNRFYAQAFFFISLVLLLGGHVAKRKSLTAAIFIGPAAILMVLSHSLGGVIWGIVLCGLFAEWVITNGKWRFPFFQSPSSTDENCNSWLPLVFIILWSAVLFGIAWFHIRPLVAGWNGGNIGKNSADAFFTFALCLGVPYFLFSFIGLCLFLSKKDDHGNFYWAAAVICSGFALAVLPLLLCWNPQYSLPMMFPGFVCVSFFIVQMVRSVSTLPVCFPRLTTAVCLTVFVLLPMLSVFSYYQSGNRRMLRQAMQYIEEHWQEGDQIAGGGFHHFAISRYFPNREFHFIDVGNGDEELLGRNINLENNGCSRIWILIETRDNGILSNSNRHRRWLGSNAAFEARFIKKRVDFVQKANTVEIWRCPR